MNCPKCRSYRLTVRDSRPSDAGASVRRRRHCLDCDHRFTTFEVVGVPVTRSTIEAALAEIDVSRQRLETLRTQLATVGAPLPQEQA